MRHPRLVVALVALFVTTLAVRAQQAPPAQAGAKPLVPMTASSLLRNPQAHIGDNVSLMATVDALLSKTAFTVDQDATKTAAQVLLVIAPTLSAAPVLNEYVTVQGEVLKFDPAEIAKRNKTYTIDLPADLVAKYQGQPVILATAVVNPKLVDLAKRVLPPMTPSELAFQKAMRTINPTFTALRGGLDAPNAAQIKEQAATVKSAFTEVETYFKSRNVADATGWAADAIKFLGAIEAGATAGKWDEVKAAAGSVQQLCATCHNTHRERQDDGSFRIKSGG